MIADKLIVITSAVGLGFLAGLYVAEERPAIELKPCPKYEMQSLTSSTRLLDGRVVCSYAKTYGKKIKQVKL